MPVQSWGDLLKEAGEAAKAFEPLEEGIYDFIVAKAEAKTAKSSGKKMYAIQGKVETGPRTNRVVFNNFVISPESGAALDFFFRDMAVLGLPRQFWEGNPTDEQITQQLTGKRFSALVKQREWPEGSGKITNEMSGISPSRLGGAAAAVPAPGLAKPAVATAAPVAAPPAPAPAPTVVAAAPVAPVAPPAPPAPVVAQAGAYGPPAAAPVDVPAPPAGSVDPWENATPAAVPTPETTYAPAPSAAPTPPPF
jgi:hypothetical protein